MSEQTDTYCVSIVLNLLSWPRARVQLPSLPPLSLAQRGPLIHRVVCHTTSAASRIKFPIHGRCDECRLEILALTQKTTISLCDNVIIEISTQVAPPSVSHMREPV
eukprot:4552866-Pyramimonas_sp.AAC.1